MKITRIDDVYCVPKTEDEWKLLGMNKPKTPSHGTGVRSDIGGKPWLVGDNAKHHCLQIPVDRFLDLIGDKPTPWRLLEAGFKSDQFKNNYIIIRDDEDKTIWFLEVTDNGITMMNKSLNITTFTELLQQMKFLGWKNGGE